MYRFTMEVGVMLLLIKDGKVLLAKRANTGWGDGLYAMVGGHMDGDETIKQAMIREAKEEIGITLFEDDLKIVGVSHVKHDRELILYYLTATKFDGKIVNNEPNKCDDVRFFNLDDLPENIIETDFGAINSYLSGECFPEFGFDNKKIG